MRTLSVNNNPSARVHTGPWSVKANGEEHLFGELDNIGQTIQGNGYVGNYGGTNVAPYMYTFPKAGKYMVKVYDIKDNIYNITFNNPYIVDLYIDWTDISSIDPFLTNISMALQTLSPNLKTLYWGLPKGKSGYSFPDDWNHWKNINIRLERLTIPNPDPYTTILEGAFQNYSNLVFDAVFPNVTNISRNAFKGAGEIHYASFPSVANIGEYAFNLGSYPASSENNKGLYSLRIGDTLQSVGINAFYANDKLTTIEFVTDRDDFVSAWNSNPVLPYWLGTAAKQEGDGEDEATITPIPGTTAKEGPYFSGVRNPKPTRLVRFRRGN